MVALIQGIGSVCLGARYGYFGVRQMLEASEAFKGSQMERVALEQAFGIATALEIVASIVNQIGCSSCLAASRFFSLATVVPIWVSYTIAYIDSKAHPHIQKIAVKVSHLLCYLPSAAILVSSAAFTISGQPLVGIVSLAFFVHDFVRTRYQISGALSRKIDAVGGWLGRVGLLIGPANLIFKIFAIGDIAGLAWQAIRTIFPKKLDVADHEGRFSILDPIPEPSELELDPYHFEKVLSTPVPAPLEGLLSLFNGYSIEPGTINEAGKPQGGSKWWRLLFNRVTND